MMLPMTSARRAAEAGTVETVGTIRLPMATAANAAAGLAAGDARDVGRQFIVLALTSPYVDVDAALVDPICPYLLLPFQHIAETSISVSVYFVAGLSVLTAAPKLCTTIP